MVRRGHRDSGRVYIGFGGDAVNPTNEFRWLICRMGGFQHPSGIHYIKNLMKVLQQKWVSDFEGEEDEWRDIPMVDE